MHHVMRVFCRSSSAAFLVFLGLIVALKWSSVFMPPIWDEAVSVFSAADYLAGHHFDVAGMLREPGCGAHWVSLMSFISALVMWGLGGGKVAWAVLHVLQWCLGAAAGVVFMRLLAPVTGRGVAWLGGLLLLATPVMLGQLGSMYVEVPVLLFGVGAVSLFMAGRHGLAATMCVLACFTKESGFLVAASLGFAVLWDRTTGWRQRLPRALMYVVPSLLLVLVTGLCVAGVASVPRGLPAQAWERFKLISESTWWVSCNFFPDHLIILVGAGLLAVFLMARQCQVLWRQRSAVAMAQETRLEIVAAVFVAGYLVFYFVLVPLVWNDPNYLPRYLVQALPFIIILLLRLPSMRAHPGAASVVLVALLLCGLANRRGILYRPTPFSDMSMLERSEEITDGYAVTRDCLAMAERVIPPGVPLVMCPPTFLLTQHPSFGYVSRALPNAINVLDSGRAAAFLASDPDVLPPRFALLYDFPRLGGPRIKQLIRFSGANGALFELRQTHQFSRGCYRAVLVEVVRKPK